MDNTERGTSGLRRLERLIADPRVDAVLVNSHEAVYVVGDGSAQPTPVDFSDRLELLETVRALADLAGVELQSDSAVLSCWLTHDPWTNFRLTVVLPPAAPHGPSLVLRRCPPVRSNLDLLASQGWLTVPAVEYLEECLKGRARLAVAGTDELDRAVFLSALLTSIPETTRVVAVQDQPLLSIPQPDRVELLATPEGAAKDTSLRALVRVAPGLRPDLVVVRDCHGSEAFEVFELTPRGVPHWMVAAYALDARDLTERFETMLLSHEDAHSAAALRAQIGRELDVVVTARRDEDGLPRVVEIAEINGVADGRVSISVTWEQDARQRELLRTGAQSRLVK